MVCKNFAIQIEPLLEKARKQVISHPCEHTETQYKHMYILMEWINNMPASVSDIKRAS